MNPASKKPQTGGSAPAVTVEAIIPRPFVRKDGRQETTVKIQNPGSAFEGWVRVTLASLPPFAQSVGGLPSGESECIVTVPDCHDLLSPGETTDLKVEIFDNAGCSGNPMAVYTDSAWKRTRHWEFYLSQEMHTDLGYTAYQEKLREIYSGYLDTVQKYMENSDNRESDKQKYKYGIESGYMLGEGYLKRRNADQIGRLLDLIRRRRIHVYAGQFNFTMENFGTEETARATYYTNRHLVDMLGISPDSTQNMFDNPSFCKSYVDVAADAGIKYGVHSMNPDRSPYNQKKQYDLFYMQGNNPENRLLIFNGKAYSDNYGFGGTHYNKTGSVETARQNILNLIAELESRAGRNAYPYDKFLLPLVPYADNSPPMEEQIIIANGLNHELEEAGYSYPRIITAFSDQFFGDVEREYGHLIPVESGTEENWWNDGWGTTAYESGVAKQTGRRLPTAETLSSFASLLTGQSYPYNGLYTAMDRTLIYDEHTWGNASYDGGWQYQNQYEWKRGNALGAAALTEVLTNRALSAVASTVKTEGRAILVYNPLNWARCDVVTVRDLSGLPEVFEIRDGDQSLPYAIEDGVLTFVAKDVPPLGYKTFDIIPADRKPVFVPETAVTGNRIENAFFRVTFAPDGTISSILDLKNDSRELIDSTAAEKFNGYRYYDDFGIPFRPEGADFSEKNWRLYTPEADACTLRIEKTPLGATARLNTSTFRAGSIVQKVTLYDQIPRIDIENEIVKEALPSLRSKEEAFYTFPFKTSDQYEIRYDLPLGNAGEGEQIYGTCTDWYTVNKWINVRDHADGCNIALATPNTGLAQFGERRTGKWSFDYRSGHPCIYSYVMNNQWQTNFQGDQPGSVAFAYAISTNRAADLSETVKFGWEISSPLEAAAIPSAQPQAEGAKSRSLLSVEPSRVILSTLKTAEANGEGLILRFHETAGQAAESARVTLPFPAKAVWETDVIENNRTQVASGREFTFDIPAYGMKTFRVLLADAPGQVRGVSAVTHPTKTHENLALSAGATASSTYSEGYRPDFAKSASDGHEWASLGEKNAWYQLTWAKPVTVGCVKLSDRANGTDNIISATVSFDDGSALTVGDIPADGSAKDIIPDTPKNTTFVKVELTGADSTLNIGLSGLEIYESADAGYGISGTLITWERTAGALYYEVFRGTDSGFTAGSGNYLGSSDGTAFYDPQVVCGLSKRYYYRVRAVGTGAKGECSPAAAPIIGNITNFPAPDAPVLFAKARETTRIDLYWTPAFDHRSIRRYDIYRDGEKIAETHDGYIASYRDGGLLPGSSHTYTVMAVDCCGNTAESNSVQAATL